MESLYSLISALKSSTSVLFLSASISAFKSVNSLLSSALSAFIDSKASSFSLSSSSFEEASTFIMPSSSSSSVSSTTLKRILFSFASSSSLLISFNSSSDLLSRDVGLSFSSGDPLISEAMASVPDISKKRSLTSFKRWICSSFLSNSS